MGCFLISFCLGNTVIVTWDDGNSKRETDALCPGLPDPSDWPGETYGRGSEKVYIESAGSDRVY